MISFIEFSVKHFVFPKTTTNNLAGSYPSLSTWRHKRDIWWPSAGLDRSRLYKHSQPAIICVFTCSPRTLWRYLSPLIWRSPRGTPKGWKASNFKPTLESLFFSPPAELFRENSRVRLRLLAEFLLRLELFNCAGGSSGTEASIKYFTSNNGQLEAQEYNISKNISQLVTCCIVWPSTLIIDFHIEYLIFLWRML